MCGFKFKAGLLRFVFVVGFCNLWDKNQPMAKRTALEAPIKMVQTSSQAQAFLS